jgi:hypothetical protein
MEKINWPRVFLCGLVAGGVWTLLSVTLLAFVGGDFLAAVRDDHQRTPSGGLHVFLLFSNLAAGLWAMWLYAAIRPRYGPGPKAAVRAGLAWWVIVSMQSAKWVALLCISPAAVLIPLAATLPAIVGATLAGAWFYEK